MKNFFLIIVLFAFGSCVSQKSILTSYKHSVDTVYISNTAKDSIYIRDSIYVKDRGDTVLIDRYHTKYIEKLRTDTLYKYNTDTIVKYEQRTIQVKHIPAFYKWCAWLFVSLIIIIIGWTAVKIYLKFHKI